jgi:hypothetical protein
METISGVLEEERQERHRLLFRIFFGMAMPRREGDRAPVCVDWKFFVVAPCTQTTGIFRKTQKGCNIREKKSRQHRGSFYTHTTKLVPTVHMSHKNPHTSHNTGAWVIDAVRNDTSPSQPNHKGPVNRIECIIKHHLIPVLILVPHLYPAENATYAFINTPP